MLNKFKSTTVYGNFRNSDLLTSATDNTIVTQCDAIIDRNLLVSGNITTPLLLIGTPSSNVTLLYYIGNQIAGTTILSNSVTFRLGLSLYTGAIIQSNSQIITDVQIGYLSTLSSDIQSQVNLLAPIASPTFTGTPLLTTTPTTGNVSKQIADTNFVRNTIVALLDTVNVWTKANTFNLGLQFASGGALIFVNGSNIISNSITFSGAKLAFLSTVSSNIQDQIDAITLSITNLAIGTYAKTASPSLTGIPLSTTAIAGTNTTQIATTAFVGTAISNLAIGTYAKLASPTFTGLPLSPTAVAGTNTTQISTTAFVVTGIANAVTALGMGTYAKLASPILSGTPTCPTAASTINNTQIATTAFVKTASTALLALTNTWSGALNTFNNDIYINGIEVGQGLTNSFNTAIGTACLAQNTGSSNTASGYFCLSSNTTGANNTGYGMGSLGVNTTGSKNTAIGYLANQNGNFSNTTSIGYSSTPSADNQIVLGTSAETTVIAGGLSIAKNPILSYRTLPTYTSNQIGYSSPITYTTGTALTSGAFTILAKTTDALPIGNYNIYWTTAMANTGANGIVGVGMYGIVLSATIPTGFSGSSYINVHNQTAYNNQNQLYTSSAYGSPSTATYSVYLCVNLAFSTTTITSSGLSNLQVIRTS